MPAASSSALQRVEVRAATSSSELVHQLGRRRRSAPASPDSCCRGCAADCCAAGASRPRRARPRAPRNRRPARRGGACRVVGVAQRVDLQPYVAPRPSSRHSARAHQDQLGIDVRPGEAERLDVELVELPVAALLRPLVAEHRARCTTGACGRCTAGCARSPRARCRRCLPGAASAVAVQSVDEGVHLLLDDVGHLADGRARTARWARPSACGCSR